MASPDLIAAMDKYQASLGRRDITVPEWSDTVIYVTPVTLKEQSIMHGWKAKGREEQLLIYAKIIVMKAEDDTGKRLFSDSDYVMLQDKDYGLISRIALEIMEVPEVEEIKN